MEKESLEKRYVVREYRDRVTKIRGYKAMQYIGNDFDVLDFMGHGRRLRGWPEDCYMEPRPKLERGDSVWIFPKSFGDRSVILKRTDWLVKTFWGSVGMLSYAHYHHEYFNEAFELYDPRKHDSKNIFSKICNFLKLKRS